MAPSERDHPLRAAPPRSRLRAASLGLGVGLAVLLAGTAVAFSIVAIPLYMLASTDPDHGLDRDLVRKGLLYVALPFGLVSGVIGGVIVGTWYGRGGRLPRHREGLYGG